MLKNIKTKVAGVTHNGRQKIIKKHVKPGDELILARERDNPYSQYATSIWIEKKKLLGKKRIQIGYLPESRAEEIAPLLDAKWQYTALVSAVTGGTLKKRTRGVNIHITLVKPN